VAGCKSAPQAGANGRNKINFLREHAMFVFSAYKRAILIFGIVALLLLGIQLLLAQMPSEPMPSKNVVCSSCHKCRVPTKDKPCLDMCPRPRATKKDLANTPNVVVLNELEYEYEGVVFNHRIHASMSAMGAECSVCHHYSEGGIIACKECHMTGGEEHLEQPGLQGAYHRQCMSCHKSWSGGTNCETCHMKKPVPAVHEEGTPVEPHPARRFFRSIEAPEKKVWQSTYGGGTVVTLHHKAHVESYGIDCAACHHAEGCGSCHEQGKTAKRISHSEAALHGICNSCHAEMGCDQCHLKQEAVAFTHEQTGWPLNRFHRHLECRACHGNPYHFTKLKPACNTCHTRWNPATFDHGRTDFVLDDNHREFECESCHLERKFADAPVCSECHDAEYVYPAKVPGSFKSGVR
jgi:hypothetical protein